MGIEGSRWKKKKKVGKFSKMMKHKYRVYSVTLFLRAFALILQITKLKKSK